MKTEIEKIVRLINRTFDKGAWHGPTVKEAISGITQETSSNRLGNTHSIIELVAHMTTWRTYVSKKVNGDPEYKVSDAMNFPSVSDWKKAVAELEESQRNLIEAVERFPSEKLSDLVEGVEHKYTYYTILHGIIHHDLYHTGQIMLIKKATVEQTL